MKGFCKQDVVYEKWFWIDDLVCSTLLFTSNLGGSGKADAPIQGISGLQILGLDYLQGFFHSLLISFELANI